VNVPEAPLGRTEQGLLPAGEGWFVLDAKDARWHLEGTGGKLTFFEGDRAGFEQLGINVSVLEPGRPMSMYHWEDEQEQEETTDPSVAYARFPQRRATAYEERWLP
jgi:hypothetical protein